MSISKTITEVCKIGQGVVCCKYLVVGPKGFECAKFKQEDKAVVDKAWNETKNAQGDNCTGKSYETLNELI